MAETPDSPLEIEKGAATKLDPDRVGDELPQEAEWLYLGAFMAALDAYEDEPEGAHYAAAWDVVNDLFDKPAEADEDERVDWEFQGESKNLVSKIDSILEGMEINKPLK